MRRLHLIILLVVTGILVLVTAAALPMILLRSIGVSMLLPSPEETYPQAPAMPPPVPETAEALLSSFESILRDQAPHILASLQPGLTDAQIDELESKYQFKLTDDLRALYRWRNGTPRDSNLNVFPEHRFVPFDEALAERDGLRQYVKQATPVQRQAYAVYAGHRDSWIDVIVDPAGDGYFFDPERSEAEGSFFFCFAEDGSYMFFPAFRNFLAATIEGYEKGVFAFGRHGAETVDFVEAQALDSRYGAVNLR